MGKPLHITLSIANYLRWFNMPSGQRCDFDPAVPPSLPSMEAMRIAQKILDAQLSGLTFNGHIEDVAAILDREMT